MADQILDAKHFLEKLSEIVAHAPDCMLSINGEIVSAYSITVQNPIAEFGEVYGLAEVARDTSRRRVLDISVNGREVRDLPRIRYPYSRPGR